MRGGVIVRWYYIQTFSKSKRQFLIAMRIPNIDFILLLPAPHVGWMVPMIPRWWWCSLVAILYSLTTTIARGNIYDGFQPLKKSYLAFLRVSPTTYSTLPLLLPYLRVSIIQPQPSPPELPWTWPLNASLSFKQSEPFYFIIQYSFFIAFSSNNPFAERWSGVGVLWVRRTIAITTVLSSILYFLSSFAILFLSNLFTLTTLLMVSILFSMAL